MRSVLLLAVCISLLACQGGTGKKDADVQVSTDKQKLSYSIGYSIGREVVKIINRQPVELDTTAYMAGFKDVFAGAEPVIPEKAVDSLVTAFQRKGAEQHAREQMEAAVEEKAKGSAFLAENKKKEGVKELPSGLQYKVIKKGTGKSPKATDQVTVHYEGRLINGTVFDSSIERGQPATFPLNRVIKGWTEGLQLMKEGAKWEFYIPSDLAYGDRGNPPRIPGGATLVFSVELKKVNSK